MKSNMIQLVLWVSVLFINSACSTPIENQKTITVEINGNCGMCETTIEKAGNLSGIAQVDWNEKTKNAVLIYDSTKTNLDEILQRIANVGYDNERFKASDEIYRELPECCQYDRTKKEILIIENYLKPTVGTDIIQRTSPFKMVFEHYFALKDALVKTDKTMAAGKAKELLGAINAVKIEVLEENEHRFWVNRYPQISDATTIIAQSKDIEKQRNSFISLSTNFYELMKVSKVEVPVYYQYCPMANHNKGAHWLSKEAVILNPYYGKEMLSCGKVQEIIK